jgi:hypothetical protein
MKKALAVFVVLVLALVLMAACTQVTPTPAVEEPEELPTEEILAPSPTFTETEAAETEPPPAESPTDAPTEAETEVTAAVDDAEALILERCSTCHDAERVFRADKTEAEWAANIDRMIDYGADVSPEEKTLMIAWLVSRNP